MLSHFGAPVPGQRSAQLLGQSRDGSGDRVTDGLGAVPGESRTVLASGSTVVVHTGQVQEQAKSGGPFDQSADGGAAEAKDEVALPVPRDGSVVCFGGALANEDRVGDEAFAATGAGPGDAERPSGAQACGEFTAQSPAALDIQRLVDRLVGDAHRRIIGEIDAEPVSDLLGAPRCRPAPILTTSMATADPPHIRASHARPVNSRDGARETVLHIAPQCGVGIELGRLWAPRTPIGMPLGRCGSILQSTATGRGVSS